ncbi:MAG: hypothetical protein IJ319_02780 [Bacteroidaceae bacterium]|nr:hypothetical protein [Bacteroidaceae bacterium]MBQ8270547.1 hypothetical protein [Bacteroidaceae bacterium]
MDKKRLINSIILLLLYVLFLSVLNDLLVVFFLPQYNFSSTWIIPVFFSVFYTFAILFIYKYKGRMSTNVIMLFKTVKLMASLAVLLVGVSVYDTEVKPFLITFLAYFMLMLLPEVYFSLSKKMQTGADDNILQNK